MCFPVILAALNTLIVNNQLFEKNGLTAKANDKFEKLSVPAPKRTSTSRAPISPPFPSWSRKTTKVIRISIERPNPIIRSRFLSDYSDFNEIFARLAGVVSFYSFWFIAKGICLKSAIILLSTINVLLPNKTQIRTFNWFVKSRYTRPVLQCQ